MQKNVILNYLQNGSSFYPFGDEPSQNDMSFDPFIPFQKERDKTGKLIKNTDSNFVKIKKNTQQYYTDHSYSNIDLLNSNKLNTEIDQSKQIPLIEPIMQLPLIHKPQLQISTQAISTSKYTLNQNLIEIGLQLKKLKKKSSLQKVSLLSRKTKSLAFQIPSLGIYDPIPYSKHLPNIQIKSKKARQQIEEISPKILISIPPVQKSKKNDFEMMFAKQMASIKRQVDYEMQRNPNQLFKVEKFDIQQNLDLEEADQLKNRMKRYFQSVKDSFIKIKNLMNIKK
ncbi:unnamed protein product (macronuclear) [Paramecium tetraurelia]|uniref:Enkurin domain-containing protein n=1 Tax=Paramecium tetraurelia TaxID=5888 RepID=A0DGY5_PARTE|nr:uncharacterized protein GSPATT00002431001 [Paramecium tetraurelia]CAK82302.1 unnamed protein product [Paramecium tetraurelia]|eukprot:XP_001449699.1 hypothetical protein (macronuclear) [Paramecium tetraurelia strain d4-2]